MACLKYMHALTALALIVSGLNLQAKVPDSFYRDYPDAYLKETKAEHDARMAWWREARLGLFLHWGLYCIPAGEWKGKESKKHYAEWTMHNHEIPLEEYSALAKQFNPVNFNADEWAELAKRAGMGYFVLTTKHHDGFAMFDSDVSDYNIVDATPYDKDVFGELARAFRERGMRVGAYYSHDLDWSVPQGRTMKKRGYNYWDFGAPQKPDEALFDEYIKTKSLPQVEEISTKYGAIDLYWFDVPRSTGTERGALFRDMVRKHQPNAIINGRIASPSGLMSDYMVPGDNGYFTSPQDFDWECCATMTESWGYKKNAQVHKTPEELIRQFSTIACAGGNLLLNIGPKPDGTIPDESVAILEAFADWMAVNREAVYGTAASPFAEFFPWGGCTIKGGRLYLHINNWREGGTITLPRILGEIKGVKLLGDPAREMMWKKEGDAVGITLAGAPVFSSVSVVRIDFAVDRVAVDSVKIEEDAGRVRLESRYGKSRGDKMSAMRHQVSNGEIVVNLSAGNPNADEHVVWDFEVDKPGRFTVVLECVEPRGKPRDRIVNIRIGEGNELETPVTAGCLLNGEINLGEITVSEIHPPQLELRVNERIGGSELLLKAIRLDRKE